MTDIILTSGAVAPNDIILREPGTVVVSALDDPEDFVIYTAEIETWFLTDRSS